MERICITGLELRAFHGVNREEREHGQSFLLDLVLEADLARACRSDDLGDTVNYARVIKTAAAAFTREACNLIERAAEVTAQAVLGEFSAVEALTLRVHKPDAPVKMTVDDIIIEIYRRRDGMPQ
ncbi:MAG: dihydroneopterin aldolase [Firmicutes bacterium]|nr:dihydroneopterin aldolase [Bacillota bacterium]